MSARRGRSAFAAEASFGDYVDLDALRELVSGGDLVLVKATYLIGLNAAGKRLPRRQDLPADALVDDAMLERIFSELEALAGDAEGWELRMHLDADPVQSVLHMATAAALIASDSSFSLVPVNSSDRSLNSPMACSHCRIDSSISLS